MYQLSGETHRYLALLKRALTNTLYCEEPDWEEADQDRFVAAFIEHYIKGPASSMLPLVRLEHLQTLVPELLFHGVQGDFIEAGVWRGGTSIFLRALLLCHGVTDRCVWVADSFEGLPSPDPLRFPKEAKAHSGRVMSKAYDHFAVDLTKVKETFARFDLLDEKVKFLKGWFRDSLPTAPISKLSLVRIDADYYSSTWDALQFLYDKLSPGGIVIIDDYGETSWTHCRDAVDEFRAARHIQEPLHFVDTKCVWWQKKAEGR